MECYYNKKENKVVIYKKINLSEEEYVAAQNITKNSFGRFYEDNRIIIKSGHIKELFLSDSDIKILHQDISKLSFLETFWIEYSNVKRLPESLLELKSLKSFMAEGNRFDKNSKNILEQLKNKGVKVWY